MEQFSLEPDVRETRGAGGRSGDGGRCRLRGDVGGDLGKSVSGGEGTGIRGPSCAAQKLVPGWR